MSRYDKPLLDIEGHIETEGGIGPWIKHGTLFVEENLNIPNRAPMSAIYLPPAFRGDPDVDVLLYLHGKTFTNSIQDYLRANHLRDIVLASKRNLIFVAPTLGRAAEGGDLVKPEGAMTYLWNMMDRVRDYGPYEVNGPAPNIRNVVLAAHSGGGYPMHLMAKDLKSSELNSECWGFDCLYVPGTSDPIAAPDPLTYKEPTHVTARDWNAWRTYMKTSVEGFWADWCRAGGTFRLFWGNGGTLTRTANLQLQSLQSPAIQGVKVEPPFYDAYPSIAKKRLMPAAVAGHDAVPKTVLATCLKGSVTLS